MPTREWKAEFERMVAAADMGRAGVLEGVADDIEADPEVSIAEEIVGWAVVDIEELRCRSEESEDTEILARLACVWCGG